MKSLKEPLSRLINKADGKSGTLWAARYKSIAVLDESALLATCIYIDLNPLAAGVVKYPEDAMFTSLYLRVGAGRKPTPCRDLQATGCSAALAVGRAHDSEAGLWLCPIEDRRSQGASRVGLCEGFSLGNYLLLLDETSRMFRPGKAQLSADAAGILDRLAISAEQWQRTVVQLFSRSHPIGVVFSTDRKKLRDAAKLRGVHHVANLNGCPTRPTRSTE
jgi:hypothetical protein